MARVPGVDHFRLGFDGAVREQGVINSAAHDAADRGGLQRIGIFVTGERDDRESLAYAANEEHGLLCADAMLARHSRERGIDFRQAVRSQQPVDLSN